MLRMISNVNFDVLFAANSDPSTSESPPADPNPSNPSDLSELHSDISDPEIASILNLLKNHFRQSKKLEIVKQAPIKEGINCVMVNFGAELLDRFELFRDTVIWEAFDLMALRNFFKNENNCSEEK